MNLRRSSRSTSGPFHQGAVYSKTPFMYIIAGNCEKYLEVRSCVTFRGSVGMWNKEPQQISFTRCRVAFPAVKCDIANDVQREKVSEESFLRQLKKLFLFSLSPYSMWTSLASYLCPTCLFYNTSPHSKSTRLIPINILNNMTVKDNKWR